MNRRRIACGIFAFALFGFFGVAAKGEDIPLTETDAASVARAGLAESTPTQGLVAWWKMEEGSGMVLRDASGNNHPAALTNGPMWTTGKGWGALSFDGRRSYVATDLDVQPQAMPESTWVFWVNPVRIRHSERQHILSDDDGGNDRAVMIVSDTGKFGVATGTDIRQPLAATANEWQHIAVLFARDRVEFYRNGVRYVSNTAPQGQETKKKLEMGRNPTFGRYFQGMLTDVRIYNRALSADEIRAIYSAVNR